MNSPLLVIGDGALGIWSALDQVFPESLHQRCWNHKIINILDKLPKAIHKKAKLRLKEIYKADTIEQCKEWISNYAQDLIIAGHNKAADALTRDVDELTMFYNFPKEHWIHLRTTNPIESVFSGVRNRTKVVKRFRKRSNAKYMIFKLIQRLSINWQKIKYRQFLPYLKAGYKFYNGVMVEREEKKMAA
jgi:transposase-like protein